MILKKTHPSAADADEFRAWVVPHWAAMAALAQYFCNGGWEDVLQESLARAWIKRSLYDAERGSARSWLLAIVADQARKANARRRLLPFGEPVEQITLASSDEDRASVVDLQRSVRRLPRRQMQAVTLHYYLDLSVRETAMVMGCSEGTVKSTLADARRRLLTMVSLND